jgi:hypothetical protein
MPDASSALLLCDTCCDRSGAPKEIFKSGGCTCDVCGFSLCCVGDDCRQFVNRIPVRLVPEEGWPVLQARNEDGLRPIDRQKLFQETNRRSRKKIDG